MFLPEVAFNDSVEFHTDPVWSEMKFISRFGVPGRTVSSRAGVIFILSFHILWKNNYIYRKYWPESSVLMSA
ncbi:hypothetical protein ACH3XW_17885 [Acanthocheilonema viteae]